MPNDFYVTFMSNVSDPLYNDLNKTSDFWTKLSPAIKFDDGKYEVALVDCILKNTYDILRKDRVYNIKVIPFDWSLFVEYEWVEALKSSEYPDVTLRYKEYGTMTDLCRAINRKISYRRNGTFHFNYSMEHDRIYITSPVDTELIHLNDNLRDVLGFKQNMINGKNAGTVSGMDQVIFADYPPGLASDSCIFLYASFVETSRVGNSNVPLLRVLERKTTHEHVHHYNIKHLQYVPVNTSYLELCQLTLRSELGDSLAITKGSAVITCHFRHIR
jgi:hypothetical protein